MFSHANRSRVMTYPRVFAVYIVITLHSYAFAENGAAAPIDLCAAQVVAPSDLSGPERKAVEMLVDEIAVRTRLRLPVVHEWPADGGIPVIAVGPATTLDKFAGTSQTIWRLTRRAPAGRISYPDSDARRSRSGNPRRRQRFPRRALRRWKTAAFAGRCRAIGSSCAAPLDVTTAPAMPIRGHQLGYRPKTNSYDAWDLAQWEQYIRDLAVFGCNSIELIPPRSDDDADSPHFPLPPMEMMIGMSQLAADYGLDVWIWYPAMEPSYSTPEAIDAAVKEWGEVLSKLPRVERAVCAHRRSGRCAAA